MANDQTSTPDADAQNQASSSNVRDTVDRAAQSAHETIDRVAARATPAIEQLQSAASNAAQAIQDKAAALGELEEAWLNSARTCVREHPLTSVLVAVAAGVLVSRIAGGRSA